jgi:hypothetical protein
VDFRNVHATFWIPCQTSHFLVVNRNYGIRWKPVKWRSQILEPTALELMCGQQIP